ncbi:hypothetical protein K1719_019528 [Acacia pycnantha]|nr:hypothetical protein K1719_019528 [Acacia pycnantha]
MYGGPSKVGRDGGPKRLHSSFRPPPHWGPVPPGGVRHSVGGSSGDPRGRNTNRGAPANPPVVEETFNLVSGNNASAFAMIIRLAPDLVEEIKRLEAQGGRARMKFDSNPNNPSGNIIDVDGKEFRFTWSREFGDLCDIYEERQSGEDRKGLLAESGSAWRKLNVQRILDESTKNHVKMRSEEAERKHKAIVIDEIKAVEATSWKNYPKKKEQVLKKKRAETLQVGGPLKSTHRPGLPSSATKGRHSSSPLPSPPEQSAAPSSFPGAVNISKNLDDVPSRMMSKQNTMAGSEKENTIRIDSAVRETPGSKGNNGAKSMDLQSLLISLLMDKPNGMTIRALEKAVGETFPNSSKKIEPNVKKFATFQTLGRYILKPGVDLESFKRPVSESGSSPEDNLHQISARGEFHDQTPALQGGFEEKVPNDNVKEHVRLTTKVGEESNTPNTIDVKHTSPNVFDDKKGSDGSEGRAGSSSDSDSESDSSGSGSDSGSHSRSRSRSPAGTGSGSSSDSESDASSNSKEASDEDVDIMTSDDEKESKVKMEVSDQRVSSVIPVKSPDGRSMQNEIDDKQDGNESDVVEIEKDLPEEQGAETAPTTTTISNKGGKASEEAKHYYPDCDVQECQNSIGSLFDEKENTVKVVSRRELSDNSERLSSGKHERGSDVKNLDEKSERTKRLKTDKLNQAMGSAGMDVLMSENSKSLSPIGLTEDTFKGPATQAVNRADRQGTLNAGLQKGYNQSFSAKSSDSQRTFDQTSLGKPLDPTNHFHVTKQFERKSSFKHLGNRTGTSENKNSDVSKVKLSSKATFESGKQSPALVSSSFPGNLEGTNKKKNADHHFEDSTRPHVKVVKSYPQLVKDNMEIGSQFNKLPEINARSRNNEAGACQGIDLEGRESNRRGPANALKRDSKRGTVKEGRIQTSDPSEEKADGRKDSVLADRNNSDQKRRESSSDENSCSYSKYEKDEPELKGPISTLSQYKEYVQEYRDKYDSYLSLNKILEGDRDEFLKLGEDLENAKGRDMDRYNNIVGQIRECYQRCGERHKRLKKIFIVLHEELQQLKQMIKDFA